jgi:hypothetical protein
MMKQWGRLGAARSRPSDTNEALASVALQRQAERKSGEVIAMSRTAGRSREDKALKSSPGSRKSNRDNFSKDVKLAVALRASHQCSFPGCTQITAGPSDESPEAANMIGEAAHIHAAAAGGRRYLESMSPEERSGIDLVMQNPRRDD